MCEKSLYLGHNIDDDDDDRLVTHCIKERVIIEYVQINTVNISG